MAASSPITLLSKIKPFKTSWKIQGKILHTWKQYSVSSGETLEMVLADEEGTKQAGDERIKCVTITFTCNPKWPEITRFLEKRNLKYDDRPDIVCRIFKIKLDALMKDLTKGEHFGKTISAMYTVEFKKRGLPHAHIVLFMHPTSKLWACSLERGRKTCSDQQGNEGENDHEKPKNEIRDFIDCRYVSASEAVWRILKFPIVKTQKNLILASMPLPLPKRKMKWQEA